MPFIAAQSNLEKRMEVENAAAKSLQEVRVAYQGDRSLKNRTAYLRALAAFSKLVTGR